MNKRIFFSLLIGLCLIFGLCACNTEKGSAGPQKLNAPEELRYEDGSVLWKEVEHASGYTVWVNGTQAKADNTSYTVTGVGGTVTVKVMANGDGVKYSDSDYCAPIVFSVTVKLASPQNFALEGNLLSWDSVQHASGYKLTVNGVSHELQANVLSYSLEDYTGDLTASLVALGQGAYRDSDVASLNGRINPALASPKNFTFASGVLHWDAVPNATSYDVYENGTLAGSVTLPQVTVSTGAVEGNLPVKIVAKAEGFLPAESAEVRCGYGSVFNPVPVSTQAQLLAIQNGTCYALNADIALNDYQPVALKNATLSGGGHTLSGITKPLFEELENCQINDLQIEADVSVATATYGESVGAFCNAAKNSTLKNITGSVMLSVAATHNGVGYAGGLVGTLCGGSLENISLTVNVTAADHVTGGLVALVTSEDGVVISGCTVTGSVISEGALLAYCGGVIGSAMTNRLSVTDTNAVAITVKGSAIVGGFAGYLGYGAIEDCKVQGTVTATGGDVAFVHIGGFVGHTEGYNVRVKNCVARAQTTVENTTETVYNGAFAGMTPSGSYGGNIYENCKYDGALNANGGVGSGRGEGISSAVFSE